MNRSYLPGTLHFHHLIFACIDAKAGWLNLYTLTQMDGSFQVELP